MRYPSVVALCSLLAVTLATPQAISEADRCNRECAEPLEDVLNADDVDADDLVGAASEFNQCFAECTEKYGPGTAEIIIELDEADNNNDNNDGEGSDNKDVEDPEEDAEDAALNMYLSVSVLALAGLVISFFNF